MKDGTAKYLIAGYLLIGVNAAALWWRAPTTATAADLVNASHPATGGRSPTIAVFFSPGDCPSMIESLELLNATDAETSMRVVGVVAGSGADDVDRIRRGAGLRFPIARVGDREAAGAVEPFGYGAAPVAVVFDPDMRVRAVVQLGTQNDRATLRRMLGDVAAPSPRL